MAKPGGSQGTTTQFAMHFAGQLTPTLRVSRGEGSAPLSNSRSRSDLRSSCPHMTPTASKPLKNEAKPRKNHGKVMDPWPLATKTVLDGQQEGFPKVNTDLSAVGPSQRKPEPHRSWGSRPPSSHGSERGRKPLQELFHQ